MSDINKAILKVARSSPEFRKALQAELGKTAIRFKTDKQVQEWMAKTDARVRKSVDGLLSKIHKAEGTLARKTKTPPAKVKGAVKSLLAGKADHPNKLAFDIVFPKARGFDFADLDFGMGKPQVEALDPTDIKRYYALAAGLGRVWDWVLKIYGWYNKDSNYRNLEMWDEKPYKQFSRYAKTARVPRMFQKELSTYTRLLDAISTSTEAFENYKDKLWFRGQEQAIQKAMEANGLQTKVQVYFDRDWNDDDCAVDAPSNVYVVVGANRGEEDRVAQIGQNLLDQKPLSVRNGRVSWRIPAHG